jgi:hypothetical protein
MKIVLPKMASLTPGSQWYEGNIWALTPKQYFYFFVLLYVGVNLVRAFSPGLPLGGDLIVFKVAAAFIERNETALIYIPKEFADAAREFVPDRGVFFWFYPPPFLFIAAFFMWMPLVLGMALWSVLSIFLLGKSMQALFGDRDKALCGLAYGGVLMGVLFGQSGCIIGACVCWVLAWRDKRPYAAGIMAALVLCKPQFAAVLFIVLVWEQRWRVLTSAAVSGAVIVSASVWCFGFEVWQSWWGQIGYALTTISESPRLWAWLTSVFSAALGMGASVRFAYAMHGIIFLGILIRLWQFYRRKSDPRLWNAAILVGSCFASPYFFTYDLPMLGAAIVLLNEVFSERGWKPWEKEALTLVHIAPMAVPFIIMAWPLYIQPLLLLALFWMTIRPRSIL